MSAMYNTVILLLMVTFEFITHLIAETINAVNDGGRQNITCSGTENCTIYCTYEACKYDTLVCPPEGSGFTCTVTCDGWDACKLAIIHWGAVGTGSLSCLGSPYVCDAVTWPIPDPYVPLTVTCDEQDQCFAANIICPTDADCTVRCTYLNACLHAHVTWSTNPNAINTLYCSSLACGDVNLPPTKSPTSQPSAAPSQYPSIWTADQTTSADQTTDQTTAHPVLTSTTTNDSKTDQYTATLSTIASIFTSEYTIYILFKDCNEHDEECVIDKNVINGLVLIALEEDVAILSTDITDNKAVIQLSISTDALTELSADYIEKQIEKEVEEEYGDVDITVEHETEPNNQDNSGILDDLLVIVTKNMVFTVVVSCCGLAVIFCIFCVFMYCIKRNKHVEMIRKVERQMTSSVGSKPKSPTTNTDGDRNIIASDGIKTKSLLTKGEEGERHWKCSLCGKVSKQKMVATKGEYYCSICLKFHNNKMDQEVDDMFTESSRVTPATSGTAC